MEETVLGIRDGIQVYSSFHTDEKELEYKDLLTNTFTQVDHERDLFVGPGRSVTWTPPLIKRQLQGEDGQSVVYRQKTHDVDHFV